MAVKPAAEAQQIVEALSRQHPNADTELDFHNPFELLVAAILSAQTTDVGVNKATPALFARFPDARSLAAADPSEVESLIKTTGFFRQKTKSIIGVAQALTSHHDGQVPPAMEALVQLPGVGRKTANVVLGHAFHVPALPVDRHVLRVSNRIGIARSDDPERVEQQLCGALPLGMWTLASDSLILHGRRICKTKPLCERCAVNTRCDYRWQLQHPARPAPKKKAARGRAARPKRKR